MPSIQAYSWFSLIQQGFGFLHLAISFAVTALNGVLWWKEMNGVVSTPYPLFVCFFLILFCSVYHRLGWKAFITLMEKCESGGILYRIFLLKLRDNQKKKKISWSVRHALSPGMHLAFHVKIGFGNVFLSLHLQLNSYLGDVHLLIITLITSCHIHC